MNNTAVKEKSVREPLFHIEKRDKVALPWWKSLLVRVVAVLVALIICAAVIMLLIGENPFEVYGTMIDGALGTKTVRSRERRIWNLLQSTAVLLCISLAVTPAFKMKFWNTGAEGQVLMGCLASVACIFYLGEKVDDAVLLPLMFLASIVASSIWAVVPAIFKAKWNTNETLFTLMMNYIAAQFVAFCLNVWVTSGSGTLGVLRDGQLPEIGNEWLLNILIVAIVTAIMYIYLRYSKHGYEISVVGESENTARYVGISVKKVIIRTLIVCGIVAGIAGFILVAGIDHTIDTDSVGGQGFTAIMVAWLAKFNPLIMIGTAFLVSFLNQGAAEVATDYGVSKAFPDIIVGIIFFCIIGCEFFIHYTLKFRKKKREERE